MAIREPSPPLSDHRVLLRRHRRSRAPRDHRLERVWRWRGRSGGRRGRLRAHDDRREGRLSRSRRRRRQRRQRRRPGGRRRDPWHNLWGQRAYRWCDGSGPRGGPLVVGLLREREGCDGSLVHGERLLALFVGRRRGHSVRLLAGVAKVLQELRVRKHLRHAVVIVVVSRRNAQQARARMRRARSERRKRARRQRVQRRPAGARHWRGRGAHCREISAGHRRARQRHTTRTGWSFDPRRRLIGRRLIGSQRRSARRWSARGIALRWKMLQTRHFGW